MGYMYAIRRADYNAEIEDYEVKIKKCNILYEREGSDNGITWKTYTIDTGKILPTIINRDLLYSLEQGYVDYILWGVDLNRLIEQFKKEYPQILQRFGTYLKGQERVANGCYLAYEKFYEKLTELGTNIPTYLVETLGGVSEEAEIPTSRSLEENDTSELQPTNNMTTPKIINKAKLTPDTDTDELYSIMAEGNFGAENVIEMMIDTELFNHIYLLDKLDIRGTNIAILYSLCCHNKYDEFSRTLLMIKSGVFSEEEIKDNLSEMSPIPFIDKSIQNSEFPPLGKDFGPEHPRWKEYCELQRESFVQKSEEYSQYKTRK